MNKLSRAWTFRVLTLVGVLLALGLGHVLRTDIPWYRGSLVGGLLVGAVWLVTSPRFFERYVKAATAESLGAIRVVVCAIALIMTLWVFDLPTIALLPTEMQVPMGIIRGFHQLPGFDAFLASRTSLTLFEIFSVVVLTLGLVGWKTKYVMPLGAFCFLLIGGIHRHYCHFFHTGLIPVYVLAALAITPCGDGLSVDRWLIHRSLQSVASQSDDWLPSEYTPLPVYGWSRYICWIAVALSYVAAGLSKLYEGGPLWFVASNLKYHLYSTALAPMQFDWSLALRFLDAPDALFAAMGIPGIYGEIAFGLVLFSAGARWILPPLMAMMHIGIFFFQDILFLDLILIQLIFVDFTAVRQLLSQWLLVLRREKDGSTEMDSLASVPVERKGVGVIDTNGRRAFLDYRWAAALLAALILIPWLYDLEFYPLSAWSMFSERDASGLVTYSTATAQYASGATQRAYPEREIPALSGVPYRTVFGMCNSDKGKPVRVCDQFFQQVGRVHNQDLGEAEKVVAYEIKQWTWDFSNDPSPDASELVASHVVTLEDDG